MLNKLYHLPLGSIDLKSLILETIAFLHIHCLILKLCFYTFFDMSYFPYDMLPTTATERKNCSLIF